jgi:hypothetical protein
MYSAHAIETTGHLEGGTQLILDECLPLPEGVQVKVMILTPETSPATLEPALLQERLSAIARQCAALPMIDSRPADEILGYDNQGLPR